MAIPSLDLALPVRRSKHFPARNERPVTGAYLFPDRPSADLPNAPSTFTQRASRVSMRVTGVVVRLDLREPLTRGLHPTRSLDAAVQSKRRALTSR